MENMLAPATPAKKTKEYKIVSDNKVFNVKLSLFSNISIEINELEKIMDIFFQKSLSLDNLVHLSRGFKICENIDEVFDILVEIFEGKKAQNKNINENSILLAISISLPRGFNSRGCIRFKQKRDG